MATESSSGEGIRVPKWLYNTIGAAMSLTAVAALGMSSWVLVSLNTMNERMARVETQIANDKQSHDKSYDGLKSDFQRVADRLESKIDNLTELVTSRASMK